MTRRFTLALFLVLAGCQNVQTAITGHVFPKVPESQPRHESELAVVLPEDVLVAFGDPGERAELASDIRDLVLTYADLGLRFYPVTSESYEAGSERPEYGLIVRVDGLDVGIQTEEIEREDGSVYSRDFPRKVECRASVTLERRRASGPALVVGRGAGEDSRRAQSDADELAGGRTLQLRHQGPEGPLELLRDDVLEAVDDAVVEALRELVPAVDRELGSR